MEAPRPTPEIDRSPICGGICPPLHIGGGHHNGEVGKGSRAHEVSSGTKSRGGYGLFQRRKNNRL